MTTSHYCLSSKTYKSRVFEGFSRLQQNDEFVDMTLAAEGCLVKVHKTLIVLASPFLKELLRSVPCKHPVLFLSNISHKALCFILEYIYTGEVNIPNEDIKVFFNAAQAMHITGLENIVIPQTKIPTWEEDQARQVYHKPGPPPATNRPCIIINDVQNVKLPIVNRDKILPRTQESSLLSTATTLKNNIVRNETNIDLHIQQSNESNTENFVSPINSGVPLPNKISEYLSLVNTSNTETRKSSSVTEDNNTNAISNIKNEDIHALPVIIEGHGPLYGFQLSNNISNNTAITDHYSNDQNGVDQSLANAANTSQVDLSSLMNISNTSLIQDHDMAVDISISDLIDNNLSILGTANDIMENPVTNKNEAINLTNYDNVVSQNTGKVVKENVANMPSATDIIDGNNDESESECAPDSGFLSKEQMDEVLEKDAGSLIYMVTERGSVQLIEHRYIFNLQYVQRNKERRRWRCIDYRSLKCDALLDTLNGVIINREHGHCHKSHDDKIYFKVMKRHCFPTLEMAQKCIKRKKELSEREHNVVDTIDISDGGIDKM